MKEKQLLVKEEQFESVIDLIVDQDRICVDDETQGFDYFKGEKIAGIAVLAAKEKLYFPFHHLRGFNLRPELLPVLLDAIARVPEHVGHNYKFDMVFNAYYGGRLPKKVFDTIVAAHLMNENERSFKLENLAIKYVDKTAADDEEILRDELSKYGLSSKGDLWKLPSETVEFYALNDVYLTYALFEFYMKWLEKWSLLEVYAELGQFELVLAETELLGIQIDPKTVQRNMDEAEENTERLLAKIRTTAGYKINPGSWQQLLALFHQEGYEIENTSAPVLERLDGDLPKNVLEFRQWRKYKGTYCVPYLHLRDEDNIIHTNFNMAAVRGTRLSSSKPNLQNVPRESDIYKVKDIFVARPGFNLVEIDYSQAELKVGCYYGQEARMTELIESGADIHQATADSISQLTGKRVSRHDGKTLNFSLQYGMYYKKLAETMGIPLAEAKRYWIAFHRLYPGFKSLLRIAENTAEQRGYIRLFTGRAMHFDNILSPPFVASNKLCQGTVGEFIRISMTKIRAAFSLDVVRQLLTVHDSIIFEIEEEQTEEIIPQLVTIMEDFPLFRPKITCDIKVGKVWGEVEEWQQAT